jgi:hypothetical protein
MLCSVTIQLLASEAELLAQANRPKSTPIGRHARSVRRIPTARLNGRERNGKSARTE